MLDGDKLSMLFKLFAIITGVNGITVSVCSLIAVCHV